MLYTDSKSLRFISKCHHWMSPVLHRSTAQEERRLNLGRDLQLTRGFSLDTCRGPTHNLSVPKSEMNWTVCMWWVGNALKCKAMQWHTIHPHMLNAEDLQMASQLVKEQQQRAKPVVPSPISGVWRYFMIYTGPITHTHFVQTAEPSRVAVRQPSPQRTSLAVISKYTDHSNPTTMQPVHAQFVFFFFLFFFFFAGNWPQRKGCKELVALKALYTSWM